MKKIIYPAASFALAVLLWYTIVVAGGFDRALFPFPQDVAEALKEIMRNGTLGESVLVSLYRFGIGYVLSATSGVALGLLIGNVSILFHLSNPIIQMLRPIAPVAWLPFVVLLIGIGDAPAIAIIFLAGFFPILLTTAYAVHTVDDVYLKVAGNYGISGLKTVFGIILPAIFPQIANALRIALGTSWIFLVSGEMVGTQSGLGYLIIDARNNLRTDTLLATMITIGSIGFLLDLLIRTFEKKILTHYGLH